MFSFRGPHGHPGSAIEAEMENLRRQIAELSAKAPRFGSHAYRSAVRGLPDIYGEVGGFLRNTFPSSRHHRGGVDRLVREHPCSTAALAGLVVLGLAAALLYTRR